MFGWMRGTARGAQAQFQDLGGVYSLAADCLRAQNRWTAHPIIRVTWTRVFVDVAGDLYALDRAKLGHDGYVFAAGICFYSNAAKRQLESIWDEAKAAAPLHATPPEVRSRCPLDLETATTRAEITALFRKKALQLHPDHGGDAQQFTHLVEARNRAMARIRR
jgi:hypothetical protein